MFSSMLEWFMENFSQVDPFLAAIPLGSAVVGVVIIYAFDKARDRKKKKLKPTPRPNRVPYDSDTYRR